MKKILVTFLLLFYVSFYGQTAIINMENVKYNYDTSRPFEIYDAKKSYFEHLKYFKATDTKTSLLVFHGISTKDSIQIVSGGKILKEGKFTDNTPGIRSISAFSNQKSLEIIFFKQNTIEKITVNSEDLKKYKYIYISPRQKPMAVDFTNFWKQFY